jgi:Fe-S cluster biosynthesis and repair protein YggX
VNAVKFEGTADPDYVRESYIQLEKNLWDKYVDKQTTLTNNERLYKIFNQHLMFIKQNINQNYNGEDFSALSRFSEWNSLEPDIKSIHMLFRDSFIHRLELDLETTDFNSVGFDKQANIDLAETVLKDPLWPINATLEKVQTHIYNQGLYYKASMVRSSEYFSSNFLFRISTELNLTHV